eukprot:1141042-Pelagomonas_calceolata.AAC.4
MNKKEGTPLITPQISQLLTAYLEERQQQECCSPLPSFASLPTPNAGSSSKGHGALGASHHAHSRLVPVGSICPAALSALLPSQRRAKINPARNSQLYVKELEAPDEISKPPGKRIGF